MSFQNKESFFGFVLLLLVPMMHFASLRIGLYEGEIIWVDNILHFITGAGVLCILHGLLENIQKAFIAGIGLAVGWEIFEYAFLSFYPGVAIGLQIFSPTIFEAAADIASNALGAVVAAAAFCKYRIV